MPRVVRRSNKPAKQEPKDGPKGKKSKPSRGPTALDGKIARLQSSGPTAVPASELGAENSGSTSKADVKEQEVRSDHDTKFSHENPH